MIETIVIPLVLGLLTGGGLTAWIAIRRMRRMQQRDAEGFERVREVARAIVRTRREVSAASTVEELFATACRLLFEARLASIAMVVNNSSFLMMRIVAIHGRVTTLAPEQFDWSDPSGDRPCDDPCITCLRTGQMQYVRDLAAVPPPVDPDRPHWPKAALAVGARSQLVLPIERNGRLFTVLSLYGDAPDAFDASMISILQIFAIDLAQAIARIEQEAQLRDAAIQAESRADQVGSLLDAIPISLLMLSVPEGRIVYVNNVICSRASMTRQQLLGKTMRELPFGLLEEERRKALGILAAEGRVSNLECLHRLRNGEIAPVLVNIEYVQYLGQLCVLVNTTDIRELREAQKAEQAKLAAEAASRAKTEFLTRLGHELRNPLNAVIGFTQLLRDEAIPRLTAKDVNRLDNIIQAGWHLLALTNDFLDLSNIELGRVAVTPASLRLVPELDFALAISGQLAIGNEVKLHADYDGADALTVVADQVRLRQVMLNLLSNAIKYNRRGGEVWVRVSSDETVVTIDVVDNGLGMTREQLRQLFEPYNRLGRESEGVEGLGVGLAVSRELLRLMNGRLEADSRPASGTRFRITLPRGEAVAPADAFLPPGAGMRSDDVEGVVLYVEDSPINALLVEQLLANFSGVRFVHAENGSTGLEMIDSLSPDLVLLDMQLPDMDGFDVLQKLRRRSQPVSARIVALSGSAMPDEVERALNMGATEYWTKPLVADRFLASISKMLA